MKKNISIIMATAMILCLPGCGAGNAPAPAPANTESAETEAAEAESFTLSNIILGESYDFTYEEIPTKIVSLASPATEMLLALGLEDSIAGYAVHDNEIPEKYKAAFDSLTLITDGWSVSTEMIMAYEPDFLMFWNGSKDYTYDFLTANGMSTYTMLSDVDGAKIESVYEDFSNMGKIFGVEARADEIINEMKDKVDAVKTKSAGLAPVSVAYVDAYSTEEAAFTAGNALVADIFRVAGGENIINYTEDPWLNVSWEEMAAADPEYIVIGVYEGASDADMWLDFLKTHPAMSETTAVKNENYVIVGLADLTVGERVADTAALLVDKFHTVE